MMISIRWRKILRDVWGNKTRSILVILSIAIGVFAVGTIVSSQAVMMRELRANYRSINPSGAWMYCDAFDDEFASTIERMPQVGEAEGRSEANVRVQTGPNQWRNMQLFAPEDYASIRVDVFHPISGDWPPKKHEVLMERSSLGLLNAQVGDMIVIETPDGRWHELRISGTVHDLNQFPSNLSFTAMGYVTLDTMEWLGFPGSFSVLHITAAENGDDIQHMRVVAEAAKRKIERGGRWVSSTYVPQPGKHPADDTLQAISLILGVLGTLVLGLSAFLIINMISALLMQQVRHIGVMKAVGARRSQVVALYLGMTLVLSIIALAIAVPLSSIISRQFVVYMANYVNFDVIDWNPPLRVYGLQIAIGLMAPLLAAMYPVLAGTRVTVREALSSFGVGKNAYGKGLVDRLLERIRGLPRPLLLSLRNTFRRKGRLALTLATLVLGGAIFIGVFSVRASMLRTLDDALAYWNYDFSLSFGRLFRLSQIERVASEVPGVVAIECWNTAGTNRVHEDETQSQGIYMIALPPHTKMLNPVILEGRWLVPEDENAVVLNTDVTKKETDIQVGDEITLMVDGRETPWRVVGIVKAIMTGPIAYANSAYYASLVSRVGRAGSVQVITEQHDPASQTRIAEALEERYKSAGMRVNARETMGEVRQRVEGQFQILVVLLLAMALLLAVVGGLGLMGTMSINVLERTREIGVMRAIGASDAAVSRIVISEGVLIGVVSWVIGTALAYPFSKVFGTAVGYSFFGGPISYLFSPSGVLIWLGVVVVLASVASFLPAHHASRLTVRDVLAYE
jgi:putative ABC transport system permease protein